MFKRVTAFLFMIIAYAILLGHSIVPHHHHDINHELIGHHHSGHDHDSDEDSNDLSHLFSHFLHSAEGFTFTNNHNLKNICFTLDAVFPDCFSLIKFSIPPLLHPLPEEPHIFISPHFSSSGLRAPPAIFV